VTRENIHRASKTKKKEYLVRGASGIDGIMIPHILMQC
jgi:hypothetical protein